MCMAMSGGLARDWIELVRFPNDAADKDNVSKTPIRIESNDTPIDRCERDAQTAPTRREKCISIAKTIAELSICVGLIAGFGVQKSATSLLIARTYFAFIGGGVLVPVVMVTRIFMMAVLGQCANAATVPKISPDLRPEPRVFRDNRLSIP